MIIQNQKVKINWNNKNKRYYESLGYNYTLLGNSFEVNIEHLLTNSTFLIQVQCDYCKEIYTKGYNV